MTRPSFQSLAHGVEGWDTIVNNNFGTLTAAPSPLFLGGHIWDPSTVDANQLGASRPPTAFDGCFGFARPVNTGSIMVPVASLEDGNLAAPTGYKWRPLARADQAQHIGSHLQQNNLKSNCVNTAPTGGAASYTYAGLIPAGCILLGVTARVTGLIGAPVVSWDLGDGVTADLFASAKALALNTTSDLTDHKNTWAPKFYKAAGDVVVTWNGGLFASGTLRVAAHYIDLTAPKIF